MKQLISALALLLTWVAPASAFETMTLKATDGLAVTADVYRTHPQPDAPWIVLAHQAGASRGEYRTIAPRLNKLGFNAIALDQRSGSGFASVSNKTAATAKRKGKSQNFLSARPDIEAGIAWVRSQTKGSVVLMGSSYSAALALLMVGENPALVNCVVSNSPGEYLRGKSVSLAAAKIQIPVLITSPTREAKRWRQIYKQIPHDRKQGFKPASGGVHGSSAFIASRNTSSEEFWQVLETFLVRYGR